MIVKYKIHHKNIKNMDTLPNELIMNIFKYLDYRSAVMFSLTCVRFVSFSKFIKHPKYLTDILSHTTCSINNNINKDTMDTIKDKINNGTALILMDDRSRCDYDIPKNYPFECIAIKSAGVAYYNSIIPTLKYFSYLKYLIMDCNVPASYINKLEHLVLISVFSIHSNEKITAPNLKHVVLDKFDSDALYPGFGGDVLKLESLSFGRNYMKNYDTVTYCFLEKMTTLKSLYIRDYSIDEDKLSKILKMTNLETLDIDFTQRNYIDDIAQLSCMTNLRYLNLKIECDFSDFSDAICSLVKLEILKLHMVSGTRRRNIRVILPELKKLTIINAGYHINMHDIEHCSSLECVKIYGNANIITNEINTSIKKITLNSQFEPGIDLSHFSCLVELKMRLTGMLKSFDFSKSNSLRYISIDTKYVLIKKIINDIAGISTLESIKIFSKKNNTKDFDVLIPKVHHDCRSTSYYVEQYV